MSTAVQVHNGSAPVEGPGTALAEIRPASRLLVPIAAPAEIIAAQEATRELITQALKEGRDYGKVQGIDKPFLMKPGAERVVIGMGCMFGPPRVVEQEIDHDRVVRWVKRKKKWLNRHRGDREFTWEEESGESLGLYRYVIAVPVILRETGQVVAEGLGSCSTMESKYIDRPRDSENTALKMAHKRALVAAALLAFGLSDQFTQDEDMVEPQAAPAPAPAASAPAAQGTQAAATTSTAAAPAADEPPAACPKCQGLMWDNRSSKTNPKAPDFKCRDRSCDGAFWPGQWPPKPKDDSQEEMPLGNGGSAASARPAAAPSHATAAGATGHAAGSATGAQAGGTSTTDGPCFPKNRKFPALSNIPLRDISTDDLKKVLPWLRDLGQDPLSDAITEILVERGATAADDGLPEALKAPVDDGLPF